MTDSPRVAPLTGGADAGTLSPWPVREEPAPSRSWFARHPAWPLAVLLAGWPLWWLLGLEDYITVLFALPMIKQMYGWAAAGRVIRKPPGFGLWVLFLIVMLAGVATLSLNPPETIASPASHRALSWGLRALQYGSVTVILLYAGNLTERELPRRRMAWLLGLIGVYAVIGGLLAIAAPTVRLTSPFAALVPGSVLTSQPELYLTLHPSLAQVESFLGFAEGRPAAPFPYTNQWGNCLAIALPWLLVAGWCYGTRRQRRLTAAVVALAFIPVVYSLDRGLWIGIGLSVGYVAVRLARRGNTAPLAWLAGGVVVAAVVVLASPLAGLIAQRLQHGQSDAGRSSLSVAALQAVGSSPLIGLGDSRHQEGSAQSIAVGRSAACPGCGEQSLGGNGQFWLLLVTTGYGGTFFYLAFFAVGVWRYRRDRTPYGMAGLLVLILGFAFSAVYEALGGPLLLTMVTLALLWRNDWETRRGGAAGAMALAGAATAGAATAGAATAQPRPAGGPVLAPGKAARFSA